jgi:hypothetical protein
MLITNLTAFFCKKKMEHSEILGSDRPYVSVFDVYLINRDFQFDDNDDKQQPYFRNPSSLVQA